MYAPFSAYLTAAVIGEFRIIYLTPEGCKVCLLYTSYDFADRTETVDRTVIKNWFGYDQDLSLIHI